MVLRKTALKSMSPITRWRAKCRAKGLVKIEGIIPVHCRDAILSFKNAHHLASIGAVLEHLLHAHPETASLIQGKEEKPA